MVTTHELTGDLGSMIPAVAINASGCVFWLESNAGSIGITDTAGNKLHLGIYPITVKAGTLNTDGTWAVNPIATDATGIYPSGGTLRYRLRGTFPLGSVSNGKAVKGTYEGPWFEHTATGDVADKIENYVRPEWMTEAQAALDAHEAGLEDDLTAHAGVLQSGLTQAGLGNFDEALTLIDADDASDFRQQQDARLNTAFGRGLSVTAAPFNAVGNGTADDSAAIRAALAAGTTLGIPVYFPEGTYRVTQEGSNKWCLNVPANSYLHGPGKIKMANAQATWTNLLNVNTANVTIDGLDLDCNKANQAVDEHKAAIFAYNATNLRVLNTKCHDCPGDGVLVGGNSSHVTIRGLVTRDCDRDGVVLYTGDAAEVLSDVSIVDCDLEAAVQPVDSEPTAGIVRRIRVIGNRLKTMSWADRAIAVGGSSPTVPTTDWTIAGNITTGGIDIINAERISITGNTIDASGTPLWNGVNGWYHSKRVTLSGNDIRAAADKEAVSLQLQSGVRPSEWSITNNQISVTGTTDNARGVNIQGAGPTVVSGNVIRGANSKYGVRVWSTGATESVTVTGNDIDGFAYGVYATTSSTFNIERLTIVGNSIDNSQGSPSVNNGIALPGTAAQYLKTVITGNLIDAVYGTPLSLGNVLVQIGGNGTTPIYSGTGSPFGVVVANPGAMYLRRDGGTSYTLYIKEGGVGWHDGWYAVGVSTAIVAKTANYTLTTNDHTVVANGTGLTMTLPDASTLGLAGRRFVVKNVNASACTVGSNGGKTIDGAATKSLAQWEKITVVSDGANWLTV